MNQLQLSQVEEKIYVIRGHKVMLDSDLAELYGVETKYFNRQVVHNMDRFPEDFAFQLTAEEWESLRCNICTSNTGRGGRRYLPYVFTENGVAMLSSVLKSAQAVQVNIAIMRIFTKLRSYLLLEQELRREMVDLKNGQNQLFRVVFERLDGIEEILEPRLPKNRKRIGLKSR
jgi:hypothetical protein